MLSMVATRRLVPAIEGKELKLNPEACSTEV